MGVTDLQRRLTTMVVMVKFDILSSSVAGSGIFAGEDIANGTAVWKFDPKKCENLTADNIDQVPRHELKNTLWRSFLTPSMDKMVVLRDGSEFTNHSDNPNIDFGQDFDTWVARVDIKKGEEMVFDYEKFGNNKDCSWVKLLCEKYCPRAVEFEMVREAEKKRKEEEAKSIVE